MTSYVRTDVHAKQAGLERVQRATDNLGTYRARNTGDLPIAHSPMLDLFLLLAIGVSSLLRSRISERVWRRIHLLAYVSWGVAVIHTLGIGTDAGSPWGRWTVLSCVAAVVVAVAGRAVARRVQVVRS